MKTLYYTATSLDGFIATEDDNLDWLFALGEPGESSYPEFIATVGALAMGSTTYRWIVRQMQPAEGRPASPWPNTQPTWVFSHHPLPVIPGADIRHAVGDVRQVHEQMRAVVGSKNIWIVGGGDLAGQFYDAGLLDELIVQVAAVTLGTGKQLLPRRILPPALRLTSVRQMGQVMVELRYDVVKHG